MLNFLGGDAAEGLAALRNQRSPNLGDSVSTSSSAFSDDLSLALELADLCDAVTLLAFENRSFYAEYKSDRSEVTEADRQAGDNSQNACSPLDPTTACSEKNTVSRAMSCHRGNGSLTRSTAPLDSRSIPIWGPYRPPPCR